MITASVEDLRTAYLLGYAYALGYRYGRLSRLAKDAGFNEQDHPRDKDGKFAKSKGSAPSGRTYPNTGKNLVNRRPAKTPRQYLKDARNNVRRALVDYYDNELRGGYVDTRLMINGKMVPVRVVFDGKGRNEFKKFGHYGTQVLDVLPFVVDVIVSGRYAGRMEVGNHFPQTAFHTKVKKVMTPYGKKLVAVDIAEDKDINLYAYSVNTGGIPSFKRKMKHLAKAIKKEIGLDSVLLPSSKDSVLKFSARPSCLALTGHSYQADEQIVRKKDSACKYCIVGIRFLD